MLYSHEYDRVEEAEEIEEGSERHEIVEILIACMKYSTDKKINLKRTQKRSIFHCSSLIALKLTISFLERAVFSGNILNAMFD